MAPPAVDEDDRMSVIHQHNPATSFCLRRFILQVFDTPPQCRFRQGCQPPAIKFAFRNAPAGIGSAFCIFARRISRPKQDRCLARSRKGSVVFWRMSLRRAIIGKSSSGSPAYAARRNDCSSLSMKPGLNRCINKRFASRRSVKPTASDVTLGNPAGGEEPPRSGNLVSTHFDAVLVLPTGIPIKRQADLSCLP